MKKHIIFLTLTALLAAFVAACNDNGTDDETGGSTLEFAGGEPAGYVGSLGMGRRKFGIRGGMERYDDARNAKHFLRH